MLWELFVAAVGALARVLFGRWLKPKDPEVEVLHEALQAKEREVETMAAPSRAKQSVVSELRQHESVH